MRRRAAIAALAVAVVALAVATALAWGRGDDAPPPAAAPAPAALDGAALFAAKGCAVCHLAPDATGGFGVGPDLRGLPAAAGSRVPGLSAPEYVRESILSPGASVVPGFGAMPQLAVSPAEADALVAHLLREPAR